MSKRAPSFIRRERDFYATPREAVIPLIPHLPTNPTAYVEPCAGDGALVRALAELWPTGTCALASDIHPQRAWIEERDASDIILPPCDLCITNPPYPSPGSKGEPTIGLIKHLAKIRPTWMLLPFDFVANRYFAEVEDICARIQPIGRVCWMGNGTPGKDNSCWGLFDANQRGGVQLFARAAA